MAPRYKSDSVKLLLTLIILLMFVILTASTKQCTPKKKEGDDYVIRNIGIKLCQLKCAEHGQCVSIQYNIETLTCRLTRDESKIEKKEGHVIPARSQSNVPTGSCTSSMCSFGQRCLKTRSGKEVCVQASTTDASEDLTPSKTVAPVTTQDCDPHTTPSPATDRNLYDASRIGDLKSVKRILAAGHVNVNARGYRSRTPVMIAAHHGYTDVVEFLVGRGADLTLVDSEGDNVLHWACLAAGHLDIVKLVLSLNKVNINARNNNGETATDKARQWRHHHLVDLLVSHGGH